MSQDFLVESLSGVRGIFGQSFNRQIIVGYARAYAEYLRKKNQHVKIVVGRDSRPSGELVNKILKTELISLGIDIVDVGIATTPMVQLAVRVYKAQGGIIITASHNEPHYNGFKLLQKNGGILTEREAALVIKSAHNSSGETIFLVKKGNVINKEKDIRKKYLTDVFKIIGLRRLRLIKKSGFKIVVDPNGGAASVIVAPLFKKLELKYIGINTKIGIFKRKIEPNSETLIKLVEDVDRCQANLGVGFDCDADRAEFVLPTNNFSRKRGHIVCGHYSLALCVDSYLRHCHDKRSTVVSNLPTLPVVKMIAKKYHAKIVEVDVGETNVVEKMRDLKSPIGGEGSNGGVIVRGTTCRDGLLSLLLIISLMAEEKKSLTELVAEYPEFYEVRTGVIGRIGDNQQIIDKIVHYFRKYEPQLKYFRGCSGGLKIYYNQNTWLFFRGSQTEVGLFRIIAGAADKKTAGEILQKGKELFYKLNKN